MRIGYQLFFFKDFASKFVEPSDAKQQTPAWRVLGDFDQLAVSPFAKLEEIGNHTPLEFEDVSWGAAHSLVLFPLTRDVETEQALLDKSNFIVTLTFTLSHVVHESPKDFPKPENVYGEVVDLITSKLQEFDSILCRSFGEPDLVSMIFADDLETLSVLASVIHELSGLPMASLKECQNLDGHLFVEVQPVFAVSSKINSKELEYKASDTVSFQFEADVECGHEHAVIKRLDDQGCDDLKIEEFKIEWSQPRVRGTFRSLKTLIQLCENVWFQNSFRQANLISTQTSISFSFNPPLPRPAYEHDDACRSSWLLSKELSEELSEIGGRVKAFAQRFLEPPQQTELIEIFRLFRCCFFRQELIGAAKDLLPFFRQLGNAFVLTDHWSSYLKRNGTREPTRELDEIYLEEIQFLLHFTRRAVRNRIEHKTQLSEVPTPNTVHHGACKLVGAYSVAFYLCWEIFRRFPGSKQSAPEEDSCSAEDFAACVCFGADGRVIVSELFRAYREFVEAEGNWDGKKEPPFSPQREGWTARLLALNISGPGLNRPEEMLVHFLHEVAEVGEWIELDRTKGLRKILARFAFEWVVSVLDQQARLSAERSGMPTSSASASFASIVLDECYKFQRETNPSIKLVEDKHPEELPFLFYKFYADTVHDHNLLTERVEKRLVESNKKRVAKHKEPIHPPTHARRYLPLPGLERRELRNRCKNFRYLIREITADIGMVAGFHAVRSLQGDSSAVSLDEVARIYGSLLLLYDESRAKEIVCLENIEIIIRRWKVQALAVCKPDEDYTQSILDGIADLNRQERLSEVNVGIIRSLLDSSEKRIPGIEKLVNNLKAFSCYGGATQLDFPQVNDFSAPEKQLLTTFMETWISNKDAVSEKRVNFLFDLWAKSLRMRFDRALDASVAAPVGGS